MGCARLSQVEKQRRRGCELPTALSVSPWRSPRFGMTGFSLGHPLLTKQSPSSPPRSPLQFKAVSQRTWLPSAEDHSALPKQLQFPYSGACPEDCTLQAMLKLPFPRHPCDEKSPGAPQCPRDEVRPLLVWLGPFRDFPRGEALAHSC